MNPVPAKDDRLPTETATSIDLFARGSIYQMLAQPVKRHCCKSSYDNTLRTFCKTRIQTMMRVYSMK
jgi:hypothetical protein